MVIQHTGGLEGIKAAAKVFLQAARGTAVLGDLGNLQGLVLGVPTWLRERTLVPQSL